MSHISPAAQCIESGARLKPQDVETGRDALHAVLDLAVSALEELVQDHPNTPAAVIGRLRGTGPAASFSRIVDRLQHDHPLQLASPFEGSTRVSGAVWRASDLIDSHRDLALAKLRWEPGARDLPMHAHTHSARFIVVLEGRGFYHVTDQTLREFDGSRVQTIAARERDVFLFTPGVVHTFSTADHAMTLLSCQLPHFEFEDPRQYSLPHHRWTALGSLPPSRGAIEYRQDATRLV